MAYLLGQLNVPVDTNRAIELLRKSAMIADRTGDADTAAPLYVCPYTSAENDFDALQGASYSLASSTSPVLIRPRYRTTRSRPDAGWPRPPTSVTSRPSTRWARRTSSLSSARLLIRASICAVPQADAGSLLSVQWYSLASQQGDPESDLALSKWSDDRSLTPR